MNRIAELFNGNDEFENYRMAALMDGIRLTPRIR